MARSTNTWIARSLTSLSPRRRIVRLAARLDVVRRRRKLDIVALVHCLVLGFSAGERRTLAGLRRAYGGSGVTGESVPQEVKIAAQTQMNRPCLIIERE